MTSTNGTTGLDVVDEIEKGLRTIVAPSEIVELRAIGDFGKRVGFFDSMQRFGPAIAAGNFLMGAFSAVTSAAVSLQRYRSQQS